MKPTLPAEAAEAARVGNIDELRAHLASARAIVRARNPEGETLLHIAVKAEHPNVAMLLLEAGADINARTPREEMQVEFTGRLVHGGLTPLRLAVEAGNDDLVAVLIKAGAKVTARDAGGAAPFERAVSLGFLKIAERLLDAGARVNEPGSDRRTPLFGAIEAKRIESVQWLIDRGADVNATAEDGSTPLDRTIFGDQRDVARLLLARGADPNVVDGAGRPPLHKAAYAWRQGVMRALLAAGVKAMVRDRAGQTALHLATGDASCVELLLEVGADPNASGAGGRTPMHEAAYLGTPETLTLLHRAGGKLDGLDAAGSTPLDYAVRFKRAENEAWLRSWGLPASDPN